MLFAYALATGAVAAAGVYMMLERNVFRVVLGLALLATAANLVIFLAGRLGPVDPAIIQQGNAALARRAWETFQTIEGNIVTPLAQQREAKMPPVLTLLATFLSLSTRVKKLELGRL